MGPVQNALSVPRRAPRPDRLPHGRLWAAMAATTTGVLPVFLFGALAALVRDDLGFSQSGIGIATSVFFIAGALVSVPGGWLTERVGAVRTTMVSTGLAACSLLGIAVLARSWVHLLPLLILAGAANAFVQPATNGMLAGDVPPRRQGLVFGIKQAAVPLATTVAGLALPVLGLTLGWRGAFAVAAALTLPVLLALALQRERRPASRADRAVRPGVSRDLVVLAVVAGLGAGTGNAMGAFYVDSAMGSGVSAALAGLFLAVGSATGIVARVAWGWWTDRRRMARLPVVAGLLLTGAGGFAVIAAQPSPALLLAGTIVAYAAGWGWNGLLIAAVIEAHPHAPAAATGVTQAGVYGGAVVVPPLFGVLVESLSYAVAWSVAAALVGAAGVLALAASRWYAAPQGELSEEHGAGTGAVEAAAPGRDR